MPRHEITILETTKRRVPHYQARCVPCGRNIGTGSENRDRAVLSGSAHIYARRPVSAPREVREEPPHVEVPRYKGVCPRHQARSECSCPLGCVLCSGCRCTCECYTCGG